MLNNIKKHPAAYVTRQTTGDSDQSNAKQKKEAKDTEHHSMEVNNTTKQLCTQDVKDNSTRVEYGDTIRTRSGHISRKPDRLEYR